MIRRLQFSLQSTLLLITALAVSLAAILQIPHVFLFAACSICAVAVSFAAYRTTKNFRPRISSLLASASVLFAFVASWVFFYIASLGPFIALSEFDRKITGHHHLGRLASVYLPAMRLNQSYFFRWYMSKWLPIDAVGLHVLYPLRISPDIVGTLNGEFENVLNFRADGTARGRFLAKYPQKTYSEWTCEGDQFVVYQFGLKRSAYAWFGSQMMNYAPTDRYQLLRPSSDEFKLRSTMTGRIYSFTRIQDREVEAIP